MSATAFYIDQPKPPGDWIGWRAWFELAGSHHYGPDIARFAKSAERSPQAVASEVRREVDNPFDRNAIAIYGRIGADAWKLGFVPRGDAKDLAIFPASMPMVVRIISIRFVADSVYVRVQLLIPSKKMRKLQGWEPAT